MSKIRWVLPVACLGYLLWDWCCACPREAEMGQGWCTHRLGTCAVTQGGGPRQGCPPAAHLSSDWWQGRHKRTYRMCFLFLLHQEDIAPQGQLRRELLILLPEPVYDLLEGHLQLPTVIRKGLQPSPGRRARTAGRRSGGQEKSRLSGEGRHSTTAGVMTLPPPSDRQHASARAVCDPQPAQHRWGEAQRC